MGRKPVLGLVGACLASVAFVGCDNPNNVQPNKNTNVSAVGSSGNPAWKTPPASQGGSPTGVASGTGTTGTPAWGNMSGSGNTTTPGTGSFNVNPKAPVAGDYPAGRTVGSAGDGTGSVEHVGYSDTSVPKVDVRHTSTPITPGTGMPATAGIDPGTGGLPPVRPLPTGGVAGGVPFDTSYPTKAPVMSTLPPLTPGGPAQRRTDDIPPPPPVRGPVVVPPTTGGSTSGAPDVGGAAPMPPPAPPPLGGPDMTPPGDLPPIPAPPATDALKKPALPLAPPARGMGVPAPPGNPANFQ